MEIADPLGISDRTTGNWREWFSAIISGASQIAQREKTNSKSHGILGGVNALFVRNNY